MGDTPNWRTSTYTKSDTCVEVADNDPAGVMIRDTKGRDRGIMVVGLAAWAEFVEFSKNIQHGSRRPLSGGGFMQQGYSSSQACRIVGINPRTRKQWRNGSHPHIGNKKAASDLPGDAAFRPAACVRPLAST